MATAKKHSGFEAPTIGTVEPKGVKIKHNSDGTISYVYPKETQKNSEKKPSRKK